MHRNRAAVVRLALFAGAVVALFVFATASGRFPSADRIRDWGDGLGAWGPVLFVPASVVLGCALTPGPVLAGAAGLLFGTALGTPIALIAAVLTSTLELLIARYLAGGQVGELLPERVRRIDDFIERRGFFAVLYIRLAPGIPYHLVNYGAGLTRLRVRDMAAGTAVGGLPRTFAYVALGGSLSDLGAPEAKIAVGLLVVVGIAGAILARRQIREERGTSREGPAR
jgi:uncharacterized membrane protein YdjX (TVP38/TMEM64 family)